MPNAIWMLKCFVCLVVICLEVEHGDAFPHKQPTVPITAEKSKTFFSLSRRNLLEAKQHDKRRLRKRFDYVDNYDWESDEKILDYDETGEEKLSLFQKMARNWKVVTLRLIFLFSFLMFLLFCCRCCCRLVCPFCCDCCTTNCDQIQEWFAMFCCGSDPAYKKFNKFAKSFGIEMDYKTFQEIKSNYGVEGNLMDSKAQQKAAQNYN